MFSAASFHALQETPDSLDLDKIKRAINNQIPFSLPEKRLLWAILFRAVQDVLYESGIIARTAESWILSQQTSPFSFLYCCEILEFEPNSIKNALVCSKRRSWH